MEKPRNRGQVARYEKLQPCGHFQSLTPSLQHHCLLAERLLGAVVFSRAHDTAFKAKGNQYVANFFAGVGGVPRPVESWVSLQESGNPPEEKVMISLVRRCFVKSGKTSPVILCWLPCWRQLVAVFSFHVTVVIIRTKACPCGVFHCPNRVKKIVIALSEATSAFVQLYRLKIIHCLDK